MKWIKGRTTGRSLLQILQSLNDEDLDKNIIVDMGKYLCRPYDIRNANEFDSSSLKDSLILELSIVSINSLDYWERNDKMPLPIIKDNKTICPCCGEEVVRNSSVALTSPPFYTYYCTNCLYTREICSREPIQEARVVYPEIPEDYSTENIYQNTKA